MAPPLARRVVILVTIILLAVAAALGRQLPHPTGSSAGCDLPT